MLRRLRRVPRPPPNRPPDAPSLISDRLSDVWRLHWDSDPRAPKRYSQGKFRFDAPAGEYAVTYANKDPDGYGCFAEVYGDQRSIAPNQAKRRLSTLSSTERLNLLSLDDGKALAALELDLGISAFMDYERTACAADAYSLAPRLFEARDSGSPL